MASDFQILGIEDTQDPALIKTAFRARIKEIHPDRCPAQDAFKNHLLFIQVNQAYTRIMESLCQNSGEAYPQGSGHHPGASYPPGSSRPLRQGGAMKGAAHRAGAGLRQMGALIPHADPAFAFYKTAIAYFKRIHPSAWNRTAGGLQVRLPGEDDSEQNELRRQVASLIQLFPKAYYYFSIVVHEYPESIWCPDAQDKMALIEERSQLYRRIIESFK